MKLTFEENNVGRNELEDIVENLDEMVSGGFNTWHSLWSSAISETLGNNGYVCTWTTECQEKC